MSPPAIVNLQDKTLPPSVGGKAANLRLLMQHGFAIPATHVIPWDFQAYFQENEAAARQALQGSLHALVDPLKRYAVRSSADIEDSAQHSFAGQFVTVLDVSGVSAIVDAACSIWQECASPSVAAYQNNIAEAGKTVNMAVIVQEMVTPVISGVSFSRNPTTGTDEIIIEAVQGSGFKLVDAGETPLRWTYKWGEWIARPEDSPIPEEVIREVVSGTARIAKATKAPVDLEWVYDGQALKWVQLREITALRDMNVYSNRMSKEMMPGLIKPLIWSINTSLVIPVWIDLLSEMVGDSGLQVTDLAKQFHYQGYFNVTALGRVFNKVGLPSEGLDMMMGMVPKGSGRPAMRFNRGMMRLLPRMVKFLYNKWNFFRVFERDFPGLEQRIKAVDLAGIPALPYTQLIEGIEQLIPEVRQTAFYNIHVPLLLSMYGGLVARQLRKMGVTPERFSLAFQDEGLERYRPDARLNRLNQKFKAFKPTVQSEILKSGYTEITSRGDLGDFGQELSTFIHDYGHLSDNNNNFSFKPWRETPELVMKMVSAYVPDVEKASQFIYLSDLKKKPLFFKLFYRRARQFRQIREQVADLYTYAYGLLRPYFMAVAQQFMTHLLLAEGDDIFYLDWDDIKSVQEPEHHNGDFKALVAQRKAELEQAAGVELPPVIYGDQAPPILSANLTQLKGVGVSPGYYSGPVCKVNGVEDIDKVQSGDVLVVPYSEVGWTPLFAKAGAVVSASGGILSHSAIIAREYHIPAVVSVQGAMKLQDKQVVTVDGYQGGVTLHE